MLEVAAQAGHGVDVCETYFARIFEGYDPARRTSAEAAILAARQTEGRPMDAIRGGRPDEGAETWHLIPAQEEKPTGGLEPPTPSLRGPSAEDFESADGSNSR